MPRSLLHPELGIGADAIIPEKRVIASSLNKQVIRRQLLKRVWRGTEGTLRCHDKSKREADPYRNGRKAGKADAVAVAFSG